MPAGTYEYKVALDGTWDESYGADGAAGFLTDAFAAAGFGEEAGFFCCFNDMSTAFRA